jgi:hypothetical protein
MGCFKSKKQIPDLYHPFNAPLPPGTEKNVYDILEYWFCSEFTAHDRNFHVMPSSIDLNKTDQSIEIQPVTDLERQLDETGLVKKTNNNNCEKLKNELKLPGT